MIIHAKPCSVREEGVCHSCTHSFGWALYIRQALLCRYAQSRATAVSSSSKLCDYNTHPRSCVAHGVYCPATCGSFLVHVLEMTFCASLVDEDINVPTHNARTLQTRIEAVLRSPRVPCGCSTGSQHAPEMTGEGNVEVEWYLRHRPLFSRAVLPFQNRLLRLCNTYRYRSPPRSFTQEQTPSHPIHPVYSTPYDTNPSAPA